MYVACVVSEFSMVMKNGDKETSTSHSK